MRPNQNSEVFAIPFSHELIEKIDNSFSKAFKFYDAKCFIPWNYDPDRIYLLITSWVDEGDSQPGFWLDTGRYDGDENCWYISWEDGVKKVSEIKDELSGEQIVDILAFAPLPKINSFNITKFILKNWNTNVANAPVCISTIKSAPKPEAEE